MILINLLPVKQGGGLQNVMSFLNLFHENRHFYDANRFIFFVNKKSEIQKYCSNNNLNYISVSPRLLSRVYFELTIFWRYPRGSKCLTFFGPPLLGSYKYFYNINGFAYSNILHPEIDFWSWGGVYFKFFKKMKDLYREYSYSFADEIIFETELLLEKAKIYKTFRNKKLRLIKMVPSKLVSPDKIISTRIKHFLELLPANTNKILLLSGPHPNKRLHIVPNILAHFKNNENICFILTLEPDSEYYKGIIRDATRLGVEKYIVNVGTILPNEVASLISLVDTMGNFSVLESFSNNFVEAWVMKKPLFVTDADWSRSACSDAALYLNIEDIETVSQSITTFFAQKSNQLELIRNGDKQLKKQPTAVNRFHSYMSLLGVEL